MVTTEQLLSVILEETRVWVREHKLKTSTATGELADDHEQARKSGKLEVGLKKEKRLVQVLKCFSCGQLGHRSPDCPRAQRPEKRSNAKGTDRRTNEAPTAEPAGGESQDVVSLAIYPPVVPPEPSSTVRRGSASVWRGCSPTVVLFIAVVRWM